MGATVSLRCFIGFSYSHLQLPPPVSIVLYMIRISTLMQPQKCMLSVHVKEGETQLPLYLLKSGVARLTYATLPEVFEENMRQLCKSRR